MTKPPSSPDSNDSPAPALASRRAILTSAVAGALAPALL